METNNNKKTMEDWFLRGGKRPSVGVERDGEAVPPAPDVRRRDCGTDDDDGFSSSGGGGEVSAPAWPPCCFGSW